MAWEAARPRKHTNAPGIDQELATELLCSLFGNGARRGGGRGGGGVRPSKPEWRCECGVTNFDDRDHCRRCSQARGGATSAWPPPPRPGRRQAPPLPPGTQADAYRRAAATARKAGAPPAVLEPLAAEERAARQRQAEKRSTARLDAAREAKQRADAGVKLAETAMEDARLRLEDAMAKAARAEETLRKEEAALTPPAAGPTAPMTGDFGALVHSIQGLMGKLENGGFAAKTTFPEDLLAAMTAVQKELLTMSSPAGRPELDAELEPDPGVEAPECPQKRGRDASTASDATTGDADIGEPESVEAVLGDLDAMEGADVEALAAMAMRLKRARHNY